MKVLVTHGFQLTRFMYTKVKIKFSLEQAMKTQRGVEV
jgi:hypothetical protein